jgi:hypothetical protein
VETLARKTFANVSDAIAAQRVSSFIDGQVKGVNTWDDGAKIAISDIVPGASLHISDRQENNGPRRYVQMYRHGTLVVTFVYGHFSGQLLQTY